MVALRLLVPCALLALLLGCPVQPPYTDDDGADDDGADDDGADDDAADDDGADDDAGDDDAGDDDSAPDAVDGYVSISFYESPDGMGGTLTGATLSGSFYDVISEASGGVSYGMPAAVDDCALTLYDYDDLTGGQAAVYDYLDAGVLTVSGPGGPFTPPFADLGNGYWAYQMSLQPGSQLQFGATYGVAASGDEFPAFDAPGSLEMPAAIQLLSPSQTGPAFSLGGPLDVAWSGGDPGTVMIYVSVASPQLDYGYIACEASNDGAFTVPAALIQQLPDGSATLSLMQSNWTQVAAGGRWVTVAGMITLNAIGTKP